MDFYELLLAKKLNGGGGGGGSGKGTIPFSNIFECITSNMEVNKNA